jgi:hypothetical protein
LVGAGAGFGGSMKPPASQRYNSGSQVALALNPVRGLRDQLAREGKEVVDHSRRNVAALRETQRKVQEARAAREAAAQATPEPFKLAKFKSVSPRVVMGGRSPRTSESPDPASVGPSSGGHAFLRKGERCKSAASPAPQSMRPASADADPCASPASARGGGTPGSAAARKPAVPGAGDLAQLAPRSSKNFIQDNAREVLERDARMRERQAAESERARRAGAARHAEFGHVPEYLVKRNAEALQHKAEQLERQDADCPPGMVRVSEEERVKTLDMVRAGAEVTRNELRKFPLTMSSMAMRNRRAQLEDKLKEQEAAIEIFQKDKVYIYE